MGPPIPTPAPPRLEAVTFKGIRETIVLRGEVRSLRINSFRPSGIVALELQRLHSFGELGTSVDDVI